MQGVNDIFGDLVIVILIRYKCRFGNCDDIFGDLVIVILIRYKCKRL